MKARKANRKRFLLKKRWNRLSLVVTSAAKSTIKMSRQG